MKSGELKIGKRYWLNTWKDVSGIYKGNNDAQDIFTEIEAKNTYIIRDAILRVAESYINYEEVM